MAPVIEIRVPRRRHFGLITAAAVTVAAVAAAAPASALAPVPTLIAAGKSKNVTGKDGRVPSTLAGDQYECTRTNPEMTIVDDSERGTVRLGTDPGHLKWDVKSSPQGSWEDAYISGGQQPWTATTRPSATGSASAGGGVLAGRREVTAQLTWWHCGQFASARPW